MTATERLDAAVAEYRRRPTRSAVAELMAAQRAWNRPTQRTQP